jgi:thiol-disulfide isomerase/thioredoxin
MTQKHDSSVVVVKRECPTCLLVVPVLKQLQQSDRHIEIYCQDDDSFHGDIDMILDDRNLEQSFRYDIEHVPTLIRKENDQETGRVVGWNRKEWELLTGIKGLGEGLPENQPGCGSKSVEPGVQEKLQARYGAVPITSRKIELSHWDDPVEQAFERGWTDGLPIVPPTDDRILRMLSGTARQPGEIVGIIPPNMQACTIEKVAVNAVMAGAKPEYMPVILAVVEAALKPEFALHGVLCTLSFSGPVILVNGPVTKSIGMNWGGNCLGQGNRANATIGRTLQLIVRNVGGGIPGEIDRAVFGNPGKYTYCFAEDETDPDWQPLHVSRGCPPGSNAVTLHQGHGLTSFADNAARSADELARSLSAQLVNELHPKKVQIANVIVAISPEHYRIFKEDGWGRKEIEEALHRYTTRPGKDLIRGAMGIKEGIDEKYAKEMMPKFWHDHGILLVRAGGPGGLLSAIIGGWSGGRNRDEVRPVTHTF